MKKAIMITLLTLFVIGCTTTASKKADNPIPARLER